ncbi:preprotein translocase subunit SecA [Pontibacillus halophilus JSM 076056 = DSM 19796]|uniref:Protein translocase subunit SecA n=1 Tax=Pontibacillus halophilus JSM 076056 = DSM 19796 TaxID=1385510 RepID=A0A0A5IDL7_9BACI|nr:accessory Sec system translocase SecA2 [Pontibacillus halophilus]KGX93937.1 preprotein translocase subunit SecA [Pontibacillus halophilus JSM 076056 = DSM 19796]
MLDTMKHLLGDKSSRQLKPYYQTVERIYSLEAETASLSDEQLQYKTVEFKSRIESGETLDSLKVEAFAVVREAAKRVLGMRPYDVQLIGGLALWEGNIAEMATGEGKTLVATLPGYLRALEGKGVHIITANEYLAARDYELIRPLQEYLGLTVGLNLPGISIEEKKAAYHADLTYGIGTEFGFDYLRDNMAKSQDQQVQRPYHYALIDEVDSVLVDEAKTPLIIAGKMQASKNLHGVCAMLARSFVVDEDYFFDAQMRVTSLSEEGIAKIERAFGIQNLFDMEHQTLYHYVIQAVRAHSIFERDVDYIVDEGEIKLVDMFTGRVMDGRTLSDGLHQALEAKEGLELTEENKTQATITVQNYFRMYPVLSGMTGTAKTEEKEFQHTYGMDVLAIPTNKPVIRDDMEDLVFGKKEEKYDAIVEAVKARHATGQPILIGTTSILQSEEIATSLDKANISYELLNAKSVEQEVQLISLAGQENQVTIATNMAGRGTDVMLGEGVAELGGLHVIGTERHESRRIDNQLKGRSGRQGDPGSSQFIISLEDELFERFGEEEVERKQKSLKTDDRGLILNKDIHKFVDTIQTIAQGNNFTIREFNLKLDDVVNDQRKVMYHMREQFLTSTNAIGYVQPYVREHLAHLVEQSCPEAMDPEDWDLATLEVHVNQFIPTVEVNLTEQQVEDVEDVKRTVQSSVRRYEAHVEEVKDNRSLQLRLSRAALTTIDQLWVRHLDMMNRLKEGIGLRQYQQEDPLRTYQNEGLDVFHHTLLEMKKEYTRSLAHIIHSFFTQQTNQEEEKDA